ncbi:MAG: hypothetical protein JW808_02415 [Victivallales bacterium]|nr:hypothetical protein [Victivallales bacterium]
MVIIRKNITLIVVLAVTLTVAGVMIFFVFRATSGMKKSTDAVADLRNKINVLNEKSPAPLRENLERIQNDSKMIKEKVEELIPIFGTPYIKPLEAFADKLGESSQDIKKRWAETYRTEIVRGNTRNLIFMNFLRTFDSEKLKDALDVFRKDVMANSREVVNEATVHGCLMEALGLPRKMDEMSCKLFIQNMQTAVVAYMRETEDEGQVPFIFHDANVEKLSFEKFETAMPMPKEVPFIFKHWRMVDDLCARIKKSGITYLEVFKRDSFIEGSPLHSDYIVFEYTMKVRGSLDSIRALLNSMMEAYRDNKVYVVKSMSLTSKDEVPGILGGSAATAPSTVRRPPPKRSPEAASFEEPQEEAPKDFGVPILGIDNTVTAEIKFEYILHVGNEIKD